MSQHEYLELRHVNKTNQVEPLVFENTRSLPILSDNLSWTVSVDRFSLDSSLVPCYSPKILTKPPVYFG